VAGKTEAAEIEFELSRLHSWFYSPNREPAGYSYRAGKVKIKSDP
jgi:hypothetical protein